jgi:hypothetical protein
MKMKMTMDQEEETTGISASPSSPSAMKTPIIASEEEDTEMKHAEIESSPDATAEKDGNIDWEFESNEADAISCKPTLPARSVSFSSIEVREYPLCIGDNPGCRRGVSSCVRREIACSQLHYIELLQKADE